MVFGQLYRWYLDPLVLQRPFEARSKEKLLRELLVHKRKSLQGTRGG